jgi:hypothetical protein
MAQGSFADDKLCCVGTVKAVDTICPCDPILDLGHGGPPISILEEAGRGNHIFGDVFKSTNNILVPTFRSSTHVPCFMEDLLVFREKLVEIVYRVCKFV